MLAVYTAGYVRTRSAAEQFESQAAGRRPANPDPARTAPAASERGAPAPRAAAAQPSLPSASPTVHPPGEPARPTPIGNPGSIAPEEHTSAAVPVPGATPSPAGSLPGSASLPAEAIPPVARQSSEPDAPTVPTTPTAEPRREAPAVALVPPPPAAPLWKDGTYYGWGSSRHGNIQAAVVIEGGRIASATIAQCQTRYPCSVIVNLPPQVAQRQNAEVDYVSGATQSADAFHYAVLEALSKAK